MGGVSPTFVHVEDVGWGVIISCESGDRTGHCYGNGDSGCWRCQIGNGR